MELNTFTVLGTGAVGSAMAHALYSKEFTPVSLVNRSKDSAIQLSSALNNCTVQQSLTPEVPMGDILFLTVPDDKIPQLAERISNYNFQWAGRCVVHCSGVLTSSVLQPLREQGAEIVAAHPIQSFGSQNKEVFKEIYFSLEGTHEGIQVMQNIASVLGSKSRVINPETKSILHVAAVLASNYVAALLHGASNVAAMSDIEPDKSLDMLRPLIETTVSNVIKKGAEKTLTGPIRRGDVITVKKHLDLIKNSEDSLFLYKVLGIITCDMAEKVDQTISEELNKIRQLLRDETTEYI